MAQELEKIGPNEWRVKKQPGMTVEAVIFAKEELLPGIKDDLSIVQLIQSASLPNLLSPVVGLPDMHEGFGLPIGGVMAAKNLVSSGAVGMDINCGVRLLASPLVYDPNRFSPAFLRNLIGVIQKFVPIGLGSRHRSDKSSQVNFESVITNGVKALLKSGQADLNDLEACEENGCLVGANSASLSNQAIKRAQNELGTLGSGNHFIEIQRLEKIYDPLLARHFGLFENQICIMVHCGSRALGQQTCLDYTSKFARLSAKYQLQFPTRNLASLPANSPEGQEYLQAMAACVNFAFVNRQLITNQIRQVFQHYFKAEKPELKLVYDVCHNIAKWETHRGQKVLVHRKGATRALPKNHPQNPVKYRSTGHPAIVPGSMGTPSFVMVGLEAAAKTYYSLNHGAGRTMSRQEAKRTIKKEDFEKQMAKIAYNQPFPAIADEAPQAYKDINLVTDTLVEIQIAKKVAQLQPLAVIKGD